jgi:hypothetical protein
MSPLMSISRAEPPGLMHSADGGQNHHDALDQELPGAAESFDAAAHDR